ncbi:rho guanine nucleotide exchange factor 18-like [Anguilla anguilla]|uniref:rho guanine nucleotide exchange factor 18-like n=1 Tax=Anguilla anguilla TaxID=7936 RepID=UPI0015ADABA5|nr:rho guanine nucleotide exchange factor 18-like [Anguilla anguilla]XP_035279720.1 rho guanine nucleotide exchange factor 18-like [Anguilla anguilla]XP_035279722.1 rho guanine nucleotide exchange factor 18-like [Anguilla anguilla]XP_035279723.1 rho guanine nucleotide exchange factor 18-like [Anguilla anguilla]XP_035279724.1 rho guanine nucleotide exchange factor 18-like [Anguilla anguilla]
MDEVDTLRIKRLSDDRLSLPASAESTPLQDGEYAALKAELELDAQDIEAESWSSDVDPQFLKTYQKEAIKRQDVIYELVQTEVHHVRTLKLMLRVYAHALREGLQMEEEKVERLFPQVENLLEIHQHFLLRLKERRHLALEPGSERNYAINRLGDILTAQFSGHWGDRMVESYGEFCSHYGDAVSFYKEQLQSNKRFQSLIRKIGTLAIVQRLGIPECLLLVTQRITKYPVLLERILNNTAAGTVEQQELGRALVLIKELIGQVDGQVCVFERAARLRDIASRLESRSAGRMKDGRLFRREDLAMGRRSLLHQGAVAWKAASGRLRDILAVLCSDVLLLLQEKDQKYSFSVVDGKPSVISLQKLIVREVAHEEKAMFLICASSAEPEMYEIHTSSKEDCHAWMALIRQAVESCPDVEEELFSEQEEARAITLRQFQERLLVKDAEVAQVLSEKLQMFAELTEALTGVQDTPTRSRLLLHCDSSDLQQGEQLLTGAIAEVENLQAFLLGGVREEMLNNACDEEDTAVEGMAVEGVAVEGVAVEGLERDRILTSVPQLNELSGTDILEQLVDENAQTRRSRSDSNTFPVAEFFGRVLKLSQRLYTLQAVVVQQDSHIELQRAAALEGAGGRSGRGRGAGGSLLEQEKQRNLERQREEMASFQRLRSQQRQEQERWQRECEQQRLQLQAQEEALQSRQEEALQQEARLQEEQRNLQAQREQYQQDLERLRESIRAVEKEREWLEQQNQLRKSKTSPALHALHPTQALFNGEFPFPQPFLCPPLPVAPDEQDERPPTVPPRRESMLNPAPKTELPIHLISATNQHKQGGVQQQIPTKLALSKSKEKRDKSKHQRSDSSASVDLRHIVPMKISGKDDGSLRGRRSVSPHQIWQPDVFPELPPPPPAHTPSFHGNSVPPRSHKDVGSTTKEDVFFF